MHPLIASKQLLFIYIGLCLFIILTHFTVMYMFYDFKPLNGLVEASVFTILYFIFGFSIWYTIRIEIPENVSKWSVAASQLGTASIFLALWVLSGNALCNYIIPNDPEFSHYLIQSLPLRIAIGAFGYAVTVLSFYLIVYTRDLRERSEREALLQTKVREAELNLLKAQINPHFLFNSLNSACSLTIYNPGKAHEMIIELSDFLRYSLAYGNNRFTRLDNEIKNIQRYLSIEKIRFGDKLMFEFKLDPDSLEMLVPGMMLQPLFENAIKHGVYESSEPVTVLCTCKKMESYTEIAIHNTFDPNAPPRKGTGTGLKNIRERLNLIYHEANLLFTKKETTDFTVILRIPHYSVIFDNVQNL
jgi:sensor histidine kinase YesM